MTGSRKVRKLSIRFKILISVSVLLLVLCLVMGISSYKRIEAGMVEMGVEEADMAASVSIEALNGDMVAGIRPDSYSEEDASAILKTLKEMQDTCKIAFLYTLYSDDGKTLHYGIQSDDTEGSYEIGSDFDAPYSEFADVFKGQKYVQSYIDSTEDGNLISAYFPIYDSDGKVVGILGSDYEATNILDRIKSARRAILLIGLLSIVLAIVILNFIISTILKGLNMVDGKIHDLVYNEGDLTQQLDIHSGDETELIAGGVNKLLEHIRGIMTNIFGSSEKLGESVGTVC